MPSKENYCYRILKSHSLIVDFEGKPPRKNVPGPIEGETFKQWKTRILGDEVTDVVVYIPQEPTPQTKVHTLRNGSGAEHLRKIFNAFGKAKDKKRVEAIEIAVDDTIRSYYTIPKDTLEDLLAEHGEILEPSVQQFFDRFIQESDEDIDSEDLLRELIKTYNSVVKRFNDLKK